MKIATCILFAAITANASIPDSLAIRCLVGEAAGEPYAAKLAVAGSLRLRDSAKGVYGANAAHCDREPVRVWQDCERAWRESATNNTAQGCRYFGGSMDDGYFTRHGFKPVMKIGRTTFWK